MRLARDRDFLIFWTGQAVSDLGDQITLVALPLTAIATLSASAAEVGFLSAAASAPIVVVSLFAGVWVDRLRRRPVLIATDLGRAAFLSWIPIAFVLGVLRMEQLYLIAFATGTLAVFSLVAHQSYVPSLVGRERIVEANGRLLSTQSLAQVAGPGLSGVLVQILTAPIPIVVDAVSFLFSATTVGLIRKREATPPPQTRRDMVAEIREGLVALLGHPVLRALVITAGGLLFAVSAQQAVFILYLVRVLGLSPTIVGAELATMSVGALAGAIIAARLARWIGLGPAILAAAVLLLVGFFVRSATGGEPLGLALIALGQLAVGVAASIFNVNGPSLRQALTPDHLLGRVNASYRFSAWGVTPLGALTGGLVAEALGPRSALLLSAAWMLLPIAWVAFSPLRSVRTVAPREIATAG